MDDEFLTAISDLYGLSRDTFIAKRNARAKELADRGDRALAMKVRQLPKPSASAWALNQLVRTSPKCANVFSALGRSLRGAQACGDRTSLDALVRERRSTIGETITIVGELVADSGNRTTPTMDREIEGSLLAALSDESGHRAVFSGRLLRAIQADGVESPDLTDAVAGPPIANSAKRSRARTSSTHTAARVLTKAKEGVDRAKRARREAVDADAALRAVRKREDALERDRDSLDVDVLAVRHQFEELEARRAQIDRRRAELERALRSAIAAARAAHAKADRVEGDS